MELDLLHRKLTECLAAIPLGVAGRVLYYDKAMNAFILAMHATSPEKTEEASSLAWESIPDELKAELNGIGFAGKQI